jgi:hypothetical protein
MFFFQTTKTTAAHYAILMAFLIDSDFEHFHAKPASDFVK